MEDEQSEPRGSTGCWLLIDGGADGTLSTLSSSMPCRDGRGGKEGRKEAKASSLVAPTSVGSRFCADDRAPRSMVAIGITTRSHALPAATVLSIGRLAIRMVWRMGAECYRLQEE
uniref:Uncharacterized protein n=1 Tax=Anopheles albimanus TaxID=7167 RepID=A0A182F578_ANOAL